MESRWILTWDLCERNSIEAWCTAPLLSFPLSACFLRNVGTRECRVLLGAICELAEGHPGTNIRIAAAPMTPVAIQPRLLIGQLAV